jgi:hypothetical protein
MKTTGLFRTAVKQIEVKSITEPIRIIPFGDVHWGSPGFSARHWREFISQSKRLKNAYFLGMGDYCDFASTSERAALRQIDLHDATRELLETVAYKQLNDFRRSIAWMGDRLLGIIGGNHTYEFADGTTADEKLANLLGVPFLGVCAVIRLALDSHGKRTAVDIFAHHGTGGNGYTEGNSINQVARLRSIVIADIYIEGHDHDKWTKPGKPILVPSLNHKTGELEIRERVPLLVRSGSFLKAYEPNARSYIVDTARTPCQLGTVEIQIRLKRSATTISYEIKGVA